MSRTWNNLEKSFTIFSLLFLTGILRWASLFVSPDPKLIEPESSNPFDTLNSLIQYFVYGVSFLLMIARVKSTIRTASNNILIWVLPLIVLSSFLWSDFPDVSLRKGFTTFQTSYFGLYIASRFNLKQQLSILAWAFGIVVIFSLGFVILFPGSAIEAGANSGALRGPFTQKNLFARILVLASLVFLLSATDFRRYRYLLHACFGVCILLILLTASKTALLILLMILILLPLYKTLRLRGTISTPLIITVILIIGCLSTAIIANWETALLSLGRDPSLSGRTTLWQGAIEKIIERPWLGYGYQGFWRDDGEAISIWKAEGYKPPHAHNGLINIALDLGLVGLAFFLLLIVLSYFCSIRWLRLNRTTIDLWPICYTTFFFVYNQSENTIIEHNSVFWTLLVSTVLSMRFSKKYRVTNPGKLTQSRTT